MAAAQKPTVEVAPPAAPVEVVAPVEKPVEAVAPVEKPIEAPKKQWVTPLHGQDLQDPTTLIWIKVGGTHVVVTPWIEMQIKGGKMALVD